MRTFVDLMKNDVQMLRVVSKLQDEKGSSPKKWLVVERYAVKYDRPPAEARRTFGKLVTLELINHSRNGHCWLTEKASQALLS